MQIFTLGRNGISLFFFAFILFSGTYSYGQQVDSCGVTDQNDDAAGNQQYFCDSEEAVLNDLLIEGANITFYDDSDYTNELDATTVLADGNTYFIEVDGCRSSVTVGIYSRPQILGINETRKADTKQSSGLGQILICVADEENPDVQVDILRTNAPEDSVIWFYSLTPDEEPTRITDPANTDLIDNAYYYAARENPYTGCISNTSEVRINLVFEPAPSAQGTQEFCATDNPTLSDIVASGDNRYYQTATSQARLSQNTLLEDGEIYYLSSVSEEGCESEERTAVTVALIEADAGDDSTDNIFCQSQIESRLNAGETPRDIFLSLLDEGIAQDGTFAPSMEEIAAAYSENPIGTFETTYTVTNELGCEDSADLAITVTEDPNAGADITQTVCSSEVQDIQPLINSLLEGRDLDGSFDNNDTPEVEEYTFEQVAFIFSQNSDDPFGTYSYTYTVTRGPCEDEAEINLTFSESPVITLNPDFNGSRSYCNSEVPAFATQNPEEVEQLYFDLLGEDVPQTGTFEPTIEEVINDYNTNNFQAFETTYTVTNEDGCSDSAELTITVNEDFNAGEDNTENIICRSQLPDELTEEEAEALFRNLLSPDADEGGDFSLNSIQEITEAFNSGDGTGEYRTIYSGGEGECGDSVELALTVQPSPDPMEDISASVCTSILDGMSGSEALEYFFDQIGINPDDISLENFDQEELQNLIASFDPQDPSGVYSITYTQGTGDCIDTALFTLTIEEPTGPIQDNSETICSADEPVIFNQGPEDVRAYYVALAGGTEGGTFEPSIEELVTQYGEDNFGEFRTVYTIDEGTACENFAELIVTVTDEQPANVEDIEDQTICSTEGIIDLSQYLTEGTTPGGTFSGEGVENGEFDASIGPNEEGYLITYTVSEENSECISGSDSDTFTIEVIQGPEAGDDNTTTVFCRSELNQSYSEEAIRNLFLNLLSNDADEGGTFSDESITEITNRFNSGDGTGTFSTTYTVTQGDCQDTAQLSITVNPVMEADVPDVDDFSVCSSEENLNLFTELGVTNGVFSNASGVIEDGMLDVSTVGTLPTITYTLSEENSECVTGSDFDTFTIEVIQGPDAGADKVIEICQADFPASGGVRNLYLDLLDEGVSREGTFNPSIQSLIDRYNGGDRFGDFTTTYTISNGDCEDSVELTIRIVEGEAPNAGEDMNLAFCTSQGAQDLYEYLADDVNTDGSFEGLEDGVFDPSELEIGEYTYTYSVTTTGECGGTDTATFTITLSDSPEAPEVDDAVFCVSQGATIADLDAGANFMWYMDESLSSPALQDDVLVEGPYYVTQTNEGGCESTATRITVTLEDTPAPTLSQGGNVFCETENPTIADLEENINETGTITWYDAETGGEVYSSSELLEDGVTYYASLTDATSACEGSQRLAVTVEFNCPFILPEAFSPNGDQINDTFDLENLTTDYPNFGIEIYNRWGNKVFTGNSSNLRWDGTSDDGSLGNGVLPAGVYFYILNYNDGQTAPIQGRVYLSR